MKYGLIGGSLSQSYSNRIHAGLTHESYDLCELAPADVAPFMHARSFKGINVTIPYKEAVIPYLDEMDPLVRRIAACNTIVNESGRLKGYNTDYLGFRSLVEESGVTITSKNCLILGTGGTAKTVRAVLEDLGAREIMNASRTSGDVTYDDLSSVQDADVIVNTTPVGMYPSLVASPLSLAGFTRLSAVFDVIYNPLRTSLVEDARKRGIKAFGGLPMLCAQAVASAGLFRGITYPAGSTSELVRKIECETENIVFIGMPGAGKSGMGRLVSRALKRPLYDTDTYVETAHHQTVKEIFNAEGEKAFRAYEHEAVQKVALEHGIVISVGGGTVVDPENVRLLRANGRIVLVNRPIEQLKGSSRRPLSTSKAAIRALYEERKAIYESSADVRIENTNGLEGAFSSFMALYAEGKIL